MYNLFPLKLYSVLAAKCYWHLSVNTFKTLDKTNKINTLLCRLNFYLLAYLAFFQQKCEQTEYIAGAGVCGIKPKTVPRRPLHHRSDFIYHVKKDDWQEEWGETDKKSEARQTRRVRRDRQEEWGETDKKSEARQTRRVRRDRQEEWGETDKKSEARQTRRVRRDRQEEWGDTDKKSEVTQTRRCGRVSKPNV